MTEEKEKKSANNFNRSNASVPIMIRISIDNRMYPSIRDITKAEFRKISPKGQTESQKTNQSKHLTGKMDNTYIGSKQEFVSAHFKMAKTAESGISTPKKPRGEFHKEDLRALWPWGDRIEDHAEDTTENYAEEQIIDATIKEIQTEKISRISGYARSDIRRAEITIIIYKDCMKILKTIQKGKDGMLIHLEQHPIQHLNQEK